MLEGLKPSNFLDAEEIEKVKAILEGIWLPKPTCWGEALAAHRIRRSRSGFSVDRVYCAKCLRSLISTLQEAGFSDESTLRKLEEAVDRARKYNVRRCVFPRGEHGIAP